MRGGRGRSGGMHSVGQILPGLLDKLGVFGGIREQRVVEAWAQAVGPEILGRARAAQLRGGTLYVEVESAALLQELRNFTGDTHRKRANEILGSATILKIIYRHAGERNG